MRHIVNQRRSAEETVRLNRTTGESVASQIEIRDLRAVIAVAEHASFARAAEALWVSRATMSEQIKTVERRLGVRLFERTTRRVSPTPAGKLFVERANRLLADLGGLQDVVRESGQLTTGRVRLGIPPGVVTRQGWHALSAFHRDYPAVELIFTETSVEEINRAIARRDVDLGITAWPAGRPPEQVASVELGQDPTGVAVAPDHPLAGTRAVTADMLRDMPLVTFTRGFVLREIAEDFCRRSELEPKIALHSSVDSTVAGLVRAELGFTVTTHHHARAEGLTILDTEIDCLERIRGLAWTSRGRLDPVTTLLRNRILHISQQEPPDDEVVQVG